MTNDNGIIEHFLTAGEKVLHFVQILWIACFTGSLHGTCRTCSKLSGWITPIHLATAWLWEGAGTLDSCDNRKWYNYAHFRLT